MEDILKEVQKVSENVDKMNTASENNNKAVNDKLDAQHKEVESIKVTLKENSDTIENVQSQVRELADKATKHVSDNKEKPFNENLAETIKEHADAIKNFKSGQDLRFSMKAVGDMSIAANFPQGGSWLQDVRNGLIINPYERTWLADLLPKGTTTSPSVVYPRENGGEGGAGVWSDKTQAKPQMDFDFTSQTAYLKWIAGIVVIERDMLDDISWLESYLRNRMLISLKTAENGFILNGTTDSNPVTGLLAAATEYNGTLTNQVERIIDAAYGQIPEDTFDMYAANTLVTQHRDAVALGLNKATGSGEYDLPQGATARFVNGKLEFGGLQNVSTSSITKGNFLTFDKNATLFISRMAPELRLTDLNVDNFVKNKITLRIEERVSLAIFNTKAIVKGTLATTP